MILEALRSRSSSIVVKGLMVLLIISFAAWGIGDYLSPRVGTAKVATVGDVSISAEQINNEVQTEITRLRQTLGPRFDREQARAFGIPQMVVNRLVEEALLDQAALRMGIVVSDDQVRSAIQAEQAFKGPGGEFDRARFRQVLFQVGMNENYYAERVRLDLARRALAQSLVGSVSAPTALSESLYRHAEEKRTAEWVLIADRSTPAPGEPSESELIDYHKEHAQEFAAPEYRAITLVRLAPEDMAKEIVVSDAEIKEAYEAHASDYRKPERRELRQILTRDEATAKRAHEMISKGQDFGVVAKEVAGMSSEATDLGFMSRDQMPPEIADPVFSAVPGGLLTPIQSPLGWHVIRVVAAEPETVRALADVREELSKTLAREKAVDGLVQLANKLEDALGGGSTLEDAASKLNLKVVKISAVDREGQGADGKPAEHLPDDQNILQQAFETEEGRDSGVVDAGDHGYFVVRVDKVTTPATRPLPDVRAAVVEKWQAAKRSEAAGKVASDLAASARESSLAVAAAARNLAVRTTTISRRASDGLLPASVREQLFQLREGEVGTSRGTDGRFVFRLTKIERPDPAGDARGVAMIADQTAAAIRNDLGIQLAEALRRMIPVSVDQASLDKALR